MSHALITIVSPPFPRISSLRVLLGPHWLKVLLLAAESNPGLDVLGGKLVNAADPTLPDGAEVCHVSGLVSRMAHLSRKVIGSAIKHPFYLRLFCIVK